MDILPNEILIKILGYLNTYDLIQFCEVFKDLDYFLKEKCVTSISDWSKRYEVHNMNVCKFICTKMNPSYIKVLKINSLYWIPGQDLRRLLQKLVNLEELHAIDTNLGFRSKDVVEYFKLRKLAVSVEDGHFDFDTVMASKSLKLLKALYLKIILKKEDHREAVSGVRLLFCNIRQLEELWVQDDHESLYRINYERLVVELKNLTKFVVRSKSVLPMYDFTFIGLFKTFECKRCNTEGELIFDRVLDRKPRVVKSIFDVKETDLENAWDVFLSLHADLPCGPKEYKLINLREDLNKIQFEDLNFCHTVILCNSKYVEAALQVLKSKNSKGLKRLNFRSCLFQDFQASKKQKEEPNISFKKARIGVKKDSLNHPFEKVAKRLENLVELEIFACPECTGSAVISAYSLIENFGKLQRLTLEIPYLLDGSFLGKRCQIAGEVVVLRIGYGHCRFLLRINRGVFRKCLQLEWLCLKLTAPNENFVTNLYQNLQYAISLKDFRLECYNLTIEKVLKGLCAIPSKKLLRLFVKCDQINYAKNVDVQEIYSMFMAQNTQLVFFFLVASQSTIKQNSDIQKTLHTYKEGNPAKIFYVKKDIGHFSGIFPIPPAHRDIIFNRTRVSVINFDEF